MNETSANTITMLPFDALSLYEQKPRFFFKMPRVVPDQKTKFETDELFRRLSRESEVRYTGYRDRPLEERQVRFQNACREGHTEIAFVATGTNFQLMFNNVNGYSNGDSSDLDFDKEQGKVHVRSGLIMNGVCVRWRGWIDLERLDGVGCLEYDEERAQVEDAALREQLEIYNQRLREFEEKQRAYRAQHERSQTEAVADMEVRSRICRFPMPMPMNTPSSSPHHHQQQQQHHQQQQTQSSGRSHRGHQRHQPPISANM